MLWALCLVELIAPTSGSGRRHILWTFIDLLSKNADCWTKIAYLKCEIKYLYEGGREQRWKELLRPVLCRAVFVYFQPLEYLVLHACRLGSVSLAIFSNPEYFLRAMARVVIITCCLFWRVCCLLLGEVTIPPVFHFQSLLSSTKTK